MDFWDGLCASYRIYAYYMGRGDFSFRVLLIALYAFVESKLPLLIVPVFLNFRYNERKEDGFF